MATAARPYAAPALVEAAMSRKHRVTLVEMAMDIQVLAVDIQEKARRICLILED